MHIHHDMSTRGIWRGRTGSLQTRRNIALGLFFINMAVGGTALLRLPEGWGAAALWGTTAIFALATAALLLPRWRLLRKLERMGGVACLNCFHDLRGLDEVGRCPECGEAYRFADTIELMNRIRREAESGGWGRRPGTTNQPARTAPAKQDRAHAESP